MRMARHENDQRETDDYAGEFIRAVMLIEEVRAPKAKEPEMTDMKPMSPKSIEAQETFMKQPEPRGEGQVRERNSRSMASFAVTTTRRNMLLPLRPCTSCRSDDR